VRTCWIFLLLITASEAAAQQVPQWQYAVSLRPELTFHDSRYPYSLDNRQVSTFNIGIQATVDYRISERFFIRGGAGVISRKIKSQVHLDQASLPPPRQSFTQELVTIRSVSYRTLLFPVYVGYRLVSIPKYSTSIYTGITGNYLMNGFYNVNFSKYEGQYTKEKWQGYSWDIGISNDYRIARGVSFTASINYAIKNTVARDNYISDREGTGYRLQHTYLNMEVGIRAPFSAR
jgi:hypothetical protein